MPKDASLDGSSPLLNAVLYSVFLLQYISLFVSLFHTWRTSVEFSYGFLIPPTVAYLIWSRRGPLQTAMKGTWFPGLAISIAGCLLLTLSNLSSNLLLGSLGFAVSSMGAVGYLWGYQCFRIVALPLSLLMLMAPIPSFLLGDLSWHLKVHASNFSSAILSGLGIPVYQDGNLLRLPNYVLEVREACSGTRSMFALLALAAVLGISTEQKSWKRIVLIAVAPLLAMLGNVVRIVGTGLAASYRGSLAANESLHSIWGVATFLGVVSLLVGVQRVLKWS